MSAAYARKSILARVDRMITDDSCKDSDGELLKEFSCISDYPSVEFGYVKEKLERKYGFKFKNYHKRSDVVEQWEKEREPLSVVQKSTSKKKIKPKTIKDEDWSKTSVEDLSPSQALERYNKLRDEDKKRRLLEEVRNVELLW